jgi:hypothetical protein
MNFEKYFKIMELLQRYIVKLGPRPMPDHLIVKSTEIKKCVVLVEKDREDIELREFTRLANNTDMLVTNTYLDEKNKMYFVEIQAELWILAGATGKDINDIKTNPHMFY